METERDKPIMLEQQQVPLSQFPLDPGTSEQTRFEQDTWSPLSTDVDWVGGSGEHEADQGPVPLEELLHHFPNLPNFIFHSQFEYFGRVWIHFQYAVQRAKIPEYRPKVLEELPILVNQLKQCMEYMETHGYEDPEAQSDQMAAAILRLKDKIELTQHIMQVVEQSREWFAQDPKAAFMSMMATVISTRRRIRGTHSSMLHDCGSSPHSALIPVMPPQQGFLYDEQQQQQPQQHPLNHQELGYANASVTAPASMQYAIQTQPACVACTSQPFPTQECLPIYHCCAGDETDDPRLPDHMVTPISQSHALDTTIAWPNVDLQQTIQPMSSFTDVSSDYSVLPPSGQPTPTHERWNANAFLHPAELMYPWSVPVSPSTELLASFSGPGFRSCPVSPSVEWDNMALNRNTTNDIKTSTTADEENEDQYSASLADAEDDDGDGDYQDCGETDEDEEDEDYQDPSNRKRKQTDQSNHMIPKSYSQTKRFRTPRQYTRRTATSYDPDTTHYLKSVFFSIYSKCDKLTKEQRRQVQQRTGLKPRNITYWFSNHKRRFQRSLTVFKETVQESGGRVKTYDDFLHWRRKRGLPDEVPELDQPDNDT